MKKKKNAKRLMIITRDQKDTVEVAGKTIEIVPVWQWLLDL